MIALGDSLGSSSDFEAKIFFFFFFAITLWNFLVNFFKGCVVCIKEIEFSVTISTKRKILWSFFNYKEDKSWVEKDENLQVWKQKSHTHTHKADRFI